MTYGDGDGVRFSPLVSLDVAGHEMMHGITQFTAGLVYSYESGALNESYSDIWGETVDLINGRMDSDEGDIQAKRAVGMCSTHSPIIRSSLWPRITTATCRASRKVSIRFSLAPAGWSRRTAPAVPAITICPGPLMFAGLTTSPAAASAQARVTVSRSLPRMAAVAPVPTGTASCMY